MAALKLISSLFVLFHAFLLLPHLVNCKDEDEDVLLQGLNSYRTSQRLPVLTKNDKAGCMADEIADQLRKQACTASNAGAVPPHMANYNNIMKKCDIDINTTTDGVVLPVCVPKLVPTLVLTNYTRSPYAKYLNDSKYTGTGVGSKDDWMVVVLTTSTPAGSFVSEAHEKVVRSSCFVVALLSGFFGYLVY